MSDKLVCSNITLKLRKISVSIENLVLEKGFIYSVLGPNGSGKTTFLNIVLGNRKNKSWSIKGFEDKAYVPSNVGVLDFLNRNEITRIFSKSNQNFDEDLFRDYLFTFKLSGFDQYEDLSKGEKKCVLLSLALASKPKVLVLDELSNGVDSLSRSIIKDCLLDYINNSNNTVIYASNQVEDVVSLTDYYLFMDAGKISAPESSVDISDKYRVLNLSLEEYQGYQGTIYSCERNIDHVKVVVDRDNDEYSDPIEVLTILGGGFCD